MIDLSDTTLFSVVYNENQFILERTARVLKFMMSKAMFSGVFLLTYIEPKIYPQCNVIQIPRLDFGGNQIFITKTISLLPGDHVMCCHEDGFILDESLWDPKFMDYDFIGSPWGDGIVGNNGFCIYSRKILNYVQNLPFVYHQNSDEFICREHRAQLESSGVRFAPTDVASAFSTETLNNDLPSFGFHGRNHCPVKYKQGWDKIVSWESSNT